MGLAWSQMHIFGKCYSTNPVVAEYLKLKGAQVDTQLDVFENTEFPTNVPDYNALLEQRVTTCIDRIRQKYRGLNQTPKILVVDDGALAIDMLDQYMDPGWQVVAVEQTRNGSNLIRRSVEDVEFPIINAAESQTKLELESPLIGRSIVDETHRKLQNLEGWEANWAHYQVLIVGYGSVGRAVYECLKGTAKGLRVYDTKHEKTAGLPGGEVVADLSSGLGWADIVIGCTGELWFKPAHFGWLKKKFLLVSGTTSDLEFQEALKTVRPLPLDELEGEAAAYARIHHDYELNLAGNKGLLLNAGYPVNFDGSIDPIGVHEIQLTRILMIVAAEQAYHNRHLKGLVSLATATDQLLQRLFADFKRQA